MKRTLRVRFFKWLVLYTVIAYGVLAAALVVFNRREVLVDVGLADDELGRLGRLLNAAFDRYQGVVDRLERFSFDASHQLRTPLASMRTSLEVCLSRPRKAPEYVEALGRVLEEVTRLTRTVEQLLTLARLEPGRLEAAFERVEMGGLLRDVIESFRPVSDAKQITVTLAGDAGALPVKGVPELLREALHNVLDNALRFSPVGGAVCAAARGSRWS